MPTASKRLPSSSSAPTAAPKSSATVGIASRPVGSVNQETERVGFEIPIVSGKTLMGTLMQGGRPVSPATPQPRRAPKAVVFVEEARPERVGPSGVVCPTCGPIPHLLVEGSAVADRILEEVYFEAVYPVGTRRVEVRVVSDSAKYFATLKSASLLKGVAEFALETEDGECPSCQTSVPVPF